MRGAFDDYRRTEPACAGSRYGTYSKRDHVAHDLFRPGSAVRTLLRARLRHRPPRRADASTIVPSAESAAALSGSHSKPDADGQANAVIAQPDATADDSSSSSAIATDATTQSSAVAAVAISPGAAQQVKPALGAVINPIQAARPAASAVGPALSGAGTFPER